MNKDETILEIMKDYPTQKIGLDDFYGRQTVINMMNKAINYTHSCTELKDKEAPSFRDWLMVNCEPTRNTNLFKKGNKLVLNTELLEMYKKEYSL